MRAGGWGHWKSGKGCKRWGSGRGSCWCRAWAHTQTPWQRFDLSLCSCQACSAHVDGVDRLCWWPEVGRWTGQGREGVLRSETVVGSSYFHSLSPPQTLPSAVPKSCFDWISHELMRQAWRTASVVEISYHILICSLCERHVCLCDLMGFFC